MTKVDQPNETTITCYQLCPLQHPHIHVHVHTCMPLLWAVSMTTVSRRVGVMNGASLASQSSLTVSYTCDTWSQSTVTEKSDKHVYINNEKALKCKPSALIFGRGRAKIVYCPSGIMHTCQNHVTCESNKEVYGRLQARDGDPHGCSR